jgi:hypothetical protein
MGLAVYGATGHLGGHTVTSGIMTVAAAVEPAAGRGRAAVLAAAEAFDPPAFLDGPAPHGISRRLDEETGR